MLAKSENVIGFDAGAGALLGVAGCSVGFVSFVGILVTPLMWLLWPVPIRTRENQVLHFLNLTSVSLACRKKGEAVPDSYKLNDLRRGIG